MSEEEQLKCPLCHSDRIEVVYDYLTRKGESKVCRCMACHKNFTIHEYEVEKKVHEKILPFPIVPISQRKPKLRKEHPPKSEKYVDLTEKEMFDSLGHHANIHFKNGVVILERPKL